MVGALGAISHNLQFYLKKIDIPIVTSCSQKTVILGTAFILRRVLGISEFGLNSNVKVDDESRKRKRKKKINNNNNNNNNNNKKEQR